MKYLPKFPLLIVFLAVGTASGQNIRKLMTVQDLVGEWELVANETSIGDSRIPERGEQRKELVRITVEDNEVTIFRRSEDVKGFIERTFIYFADGRGETNHWTTEDGTAMEKVTKTRWADGKLLTKGKYKSRLGSMGLESRCRLSNDLLKLECEEIQLSTGSQPPPFARGLVTKTVFRRL